MDIEVLNDQWIPRVYIDVNAMARVQATVHLCEKEVGWMGLVRTSEDSKGRPVLTLTDPYVPAQEVSGGTCDLDPTGKGSFAEWAMGLGADAQYIKWWGHSHVNMGVSPSGTDMKTFWEHVENDPDTPFVMTIHNKSNSIYSNLYLGKGMYVKDATVYVDYGTASIIADVDQQLKDNVREKVYVKSNAANWHNPGYGSSKYPVSYSGSGGDRVKSGKSASKKRNAESNTMGLRQGGKSQPPKPTVRVGGRRKKQGKSNAGNSAA